MKHKLTILNFSFVLLLCLIFVVPIISPSVTPVPVLAAEEEEEDNFTTLPNWRWKNQTETNSSVVEELIGDQYVINSTNKGNGTLSFEKSRELNSRDFYFETRFALDIRGYGEYSREVIGDTWDFEEGDDEDWGIAGSIVSGGYINGTFDSVQRFWNSPNVNINTSLYDTIVVKLNSSDPTMQFRIHADCGSEQTGISDYQYLTSTQTEYVFDVSDHVNWNGTASKMMIVFQEDDTPFEEDEEVYMDYFFVEASNTTDGFKFSLLNADEEEGMAFGFTGNLGDSYNISIDMYNETGGIALDYDYSFDYSMDDDGWLLLRVDWNLDKRQVKTVFEFENGTDIVKIRRITDLYGSNIGFSELSLLEEGFPALCMNNTIGEYARSYVIISYIDANWVVINWRTPDSGSQWEFTPNDITVTQGPASRFSGVSPYGATSFKDSMAATDQWYTLAIDRFDGLSFDYKGFIDGFDGAEADDYMDYVIGMYNIKADGSLDPLFRYYIHMYSIGGGSPVDLILHQLYTRSVQTLQRYSDQGTSNCEGSISLFFDTDQRIILQYRYDDTNYNFHGTQVVNPTGGGSFTKEMVFVVAYRAKTVGLEDDTLEFTIGGFDITRKDIIGGMVGAILGPFVAILGMIFSPFILLFQMMTLALVKAFKEMASSLEPFFDALGSVFEIAISALGDTFGGIIDNLELAIGGFLEDLGEYLETAFEGLWAILFGLAEGFGAFVVTVMEWIFPIFAEVLIWIWGVAASIVFWIWAELGLPDLLAILGLIITVVFAAINAVPAMLQALIDLFIFWHLWILIGIWIIILPMQAAQCEGVSDFLDRIIEILAIDSFPFEIAGFGFWFPLAIPLLFWTCAEIIVLV